MNQILREKLNVEKFEEIKKNFKNVYWDDELNSHNYCFIRKFCFMGYDLKKLTLLGCEVVGFFVKDGEVELQIKL